MQTEFAGVLRVKAYLFCFTQITVDQPKLIVNGSVLSDTPGRTIPDVCLCLAQLEWWGSLALTVC